MRWLVLAAAGIVGFQLFAPPVVGLANQSDFKRIIGKFGWGPEPPEELFAFINLKYVPSASYHVREWEQFSSEDLFVGLALLVNKVVSTDGRLDIRVMGLIHALAFLAAFTALLYSTRGIPGQRFLWMAMSLAAMDTAYIVYLNSFYSEPASYVFCLLLLAESIAICRFGVSTRALLRWSLWAVLLVLAKPINAPLGVLLGLFALRMPVLKYNSPKLQPWAGKLGAAAILLSSVFSLATVPAALTGANTYNMVFLCLLPESRTPGADAVALGFKPGTEDLQRTGAWSPDNGFAALTNSGLIGRKVTLLTVLGFYLAHPTRFWRHIRESLKLSMSLRPELGNFARGAGHPPLSTSKAFSVWSSFRSEIVFRAPRLPFFFLLIVPLAALGWRALHSGIDGVPAEFLALLALCCLTSFLTASFGDCWDLVRHMFLFNVLLDACLLSVAGLAWLAIYDRRATLAV